MPPQDLPLTLEACRSSDPRAQRRLYQQFYAYGITVALYYCDDRSEAEEVLQDSFLSVFRHLESKHIPKEFLPWFRRIVINKSIDYYRKRQSSWRVFKLPVTQPMATHNEAIDALNQRDLYHILQKLPATYRLVFNLHVLEGLKHPEIAQQLGISIGTSKSNLSKA
ncbi:MAG: sigma-70 family RNA polymerase sigma factor, partial [Bacteroidota bacterium]